MSNNFQQTVNLKDELARAKEPARKKKETKNIEHLYQDLEDREDIKKINHPTNQEHNNAIYRKLVMIIIFLVVIIAGAWYLRNSGKNTDTNQTNQATKQTKWYMVKLADNEIFYGQIANLTADPIIVNNVYYNYDQAVASTTEVKDQTNLRLVKRGNEMHGPDGSMNVVRGQVLYMEPLKGESKVLKAILEYEK